MSKAIKFNDSFDTVTMEYLDIQVQMTQIREKLNEVSQKMKYAGAYLELESTQQATELKVQLGIPVDPARAVCLEEMKACKQHGIAKELHELEKTYNELFNTQRMLEAKALIHEKQMDFLITFQENANRKVRVLQMN